MYRVQNAKCKVPNAKRETSHEMHLRLANHRPSRRLVPRRGRGRRHAATRACPGRGLPQIKELPNPFVFADGSPVRNREDWQRRREEIKGLFQD